MRRTFYRFPHLAVATVNLAPVVRVMYISRHEQLSGCFKRNRTTEGMFTEPIRPRRMKSVRRDGEGFDVFMSQV